MSIRKILVPGIAGSGPEHWQTLWQADDATLERIAQRDFLYPNRDEWVSTLEAAALAREEPVVFIGHSLGCQTIVQWARTGSVQRAAGAVLVGPSDTESLPYARELPGFLPTRLEPLPFPTLIIASSDDPYVSLGRAHEFASAWGSRIIEIGAAGHISTDSGYGPWPEGRRLVDDFVGGLEGVSSVSR